MPSSGHENTILSLSEANALFRCGHFAELARRARPRDRVPTDPSMRVLVAHALVLTGDWAAAETLLPADGDEASLQIKSRTDLVRGLIAHATGALTSAAQYFRAAFRRANESKDAQSIAWISV